MSGSVALKTCRCEGLRHLEKSRKSRTEGRTKKHAQNKSLSLPYLSQYCLASGPRLRATMPERVAALSKHSITTVCSESSLACALMASDSSSNRQMLLEII